MILIFEGADNSGKTTIAKELSRIIGFQYFKHSNQKSNFETISRYKQIIEANFFIDFLSQINLDLIIDRHIISEYAYSKAYRRPVFFDEILKIDKQLAKLGAKVIYCHKNVLKNYRDEIIDAYMVPKIQKAYEWYLDHHISMPHLFLHTTDENLENQIHKIVRWMS